MKIHSYICSVQEVDSFKISYLDGFETQKNGISSQKMIKNKFDDEKNKKVILLSNAVMTKQLHNLEGKFVQLQ